MEPLTPDEFEALSPDDQVTYLQLLSVEADAWTLSPRQQQAEDLAHQVDELLYGGAAGGGKSEWLLWHVLNLSLHHPGHKSLVLRSNFPELRRTLIRNSISRYASVPVKDRPVWRASAAEWRFPNGSVIDFGHCETDEDVRKYLSAEYDCIAFDELTEFTDYQYDMLRTRLRTKKTQAESGVHPHVIACSNPGQRGHIWVKKLFVDPEPDGYGTHTLTTDHAGHTYTRQIGYCRATVHDNPHIDPNYIRSLATAPERLRRLYLEGDWNAFEGGYFPDYHPTRVDEHGEHPWHRIPPFNPPEHWPRWRAVDYGHAAPYCCLWATRNPDTGQTIIYREHYTAGLTATEQTRHINQLSRHPDGTPETIRWTSLDPSCWRREGTGTNIANTYQQHHIPVRKADNRRIDGWNRLHEHLQTQLPTPNGPTPSLTITHNCTNLHNELTNAQHDPHNPEDLNTHQPDHALDTLRYLLMHHPPPNPTPHTTPNWQTRHWNQTTHKPTIDYPPHTP